MSETTNNGTHSAGRNGSRTRQNGRENGQKNNQASAAGGRTIPSDAQAEMAVLGAMLLGDKSAIDLATEKLTPDSFHNPLHGHVFSAMCDIAGRDGAIDIVTLCNKLDAEGALPGGAAEIRVWLTQLGDIEFTTRNLSDYLEIVADLATLRRAIEAAQLIAQSAYAQDLPIPQFLDDAERRIFALREGRGRDASRDTLRHLMQIETDLLDDRQQNLKNGIVTGLATDFDELDYLMDGGLEDGLLYVIGGRPGMGKTVSGCEIARNVLRRATGEVVHIQSLEMNKGQIARRMVCAEAKLSLRKVKRGDLTDMEWAQWNEAYARLFDGRCVVDDTPGLTPLQLKAALRKTRNEMGRLDLVVVDYLQLLNGSGKTNSNKNDEVTYISDSLKAIAKEFKVPVIALAQLSRGVERREDKRPSLSDLRDSGGVEQAADVVMLLYRAAYYAKKEDAATNTQTGYGATSPDPVEFIVAKNRDGATGTVKLAFTGDNVRFDNLDERHTEF